MDKLMMKYKVQLSVATIIAALLFVWNTSRIVTAKESGINQRLTTTEVDTVANGVHIKDLRTKYVACESSTTEVVGDIKLIRKDLGYMQDDMGKMRNAIERIADKLDDIDQ